MLRKVAFLVFSLCVFHSVHGQKLDSLQAILKNETIDSVRMKLLNQIGEILITSQDPEALSYFEEVLSLAESSGNELITTVALNRIGTYWYQRREFNKATEYYFQALESAKDQPEYYDVLARIHNNIGWNFNQLGYTDKAIEQYRQGLKYANLLKNVTLQGHILNNQGVAYKNLQDYDSALYFLHTSLAINRSAGNTKLEQFNLNNICVILIQRKQYAEAIRNLDDLYKINVELRDTTEIINNLLNLAEANLQLKWLDKAEDAGIQALILAEAINNQQLAQSVSMQLYKITKEQQRYKIALEYLTRSYQLSDSINASGNDKYTLELETKYNALKKDKELQDANKKIIEQKLYNAITFSALGITILAIIFFWRLVRIKKKSEIKLVKLNNEIQIQSEELKQVNEEIKAANENLEKTVTARTAVIMNQNIRLREFTFMNSHRIRGPVASILGIINLLQDKRNDEMKPEILEHLKNTTQELDVVIREVNRYLEHDDDFFKDLESSDPKRD